MGLHDLLRGQLWFLYLDDGRTSRKTHLWISTACYGDSVTFLYVDDIPTSIGNTPMDLQGLLRR
jgi:hypothetical protein